MGTWSVGLYGGDFAMDLRSAVAAVARLPFEPDRLVELLCGIEPAAARHAEDPDHATFWLILADQFTKRGLVSARVTDAALALIASAASDAAKLGMKPADIRRRSKVLEELRGRLLAPPSLSHPRKVLKSPQPFVMDVGQMLTYPTDHGRPINPCFKSKELIRSWSKEGVQRTWTADGWAALVVVERAHAFEYLAWYRAAVARQSTIDKPTSDAMLADDITWRIARAGTCTRLHMTRMEFERIGQVTIDPHAITALFPDLRPGLSAAISDISIANDMDVIPARIAGTDPPRMAPSTRRPTFAGLRKILADHGI
jgi:hypothetical protein